MRSIAIGVLALIATAAAAEEYKAPPLASHVVDSANLLASNDRDALDAKMERIRQASGVEIVAFVVGDLGDRSIEDVAYGAFNQWHIGQRGADNGVLLVVAPHERRVRIETGRGVGGALTDLQASDIIEHVIAPQLKAGNYASAIDGGITAIAHALAPAAADATANDAAPIASAPTVNSPPSKLTLIASGIGLAVFFVLLIVSSRFRAMAWSIFKWVLIFRFFGGRGGGISSGGGGGYSGGGGSSGGGGASGSY